MLLITKAFYIKSIIQAKDTFFKKFLRIPTVNQFISDLLTVRNFIHVDL